MVKTGATVPRRLICRDHASVVIPGSNGKEQRHGTADVLIGRDKHGSTLHAFFLEQRPFQAFMSYTYTGVSCAPGFRAIRWLWPKCPLPMSGPSRRPGARNYLLPTAASSTA